MKRVVKFFRALGDALGLVVFLGGLLLATNNLAARRATMKWRRAAPAKEIAPAATQQARATA